MDLSCGVDRVNHTSPLGVANVLITLDGDYIFTNNIETLWVSDACLLHRKWLQSCEFHDVLSAERVTLPLENLDHEKLEAYNGNQRILMALE